MNLLCAPSQIRSDIAADWMGSKSKSKSQWNCMLLLAKSTTEVQQCLNHCADPNDSDQWAVRNIINKDNPFLGERATAVEYCFGHGLSPNKKSAQSLLHHCTDEHSAHILLDHGVLFDRKDRHGFTALQHALSEHNWGVAHVLIKRGAQLHPLDTETSLLSTLVHLVRMWVLWEPSVMHVVGEHLLNYVPVHGQQDLKEQIAAAAYDALQRDPSLSWPKMFTHLSSYAQTEWDPSTLYPSIMGRSALWWAASCNDIAVVRYLSKCGMDVNAVDSSGQSALHAAIANQCFEVVNLLLSSGAHPNCQDELGRTPLHVLAEIGKNNHLHCLDVFGFNLDLIVAALLHYGADVSLANKQGVPAGQPLPIMAVQNPDLYESNMWITAQCYNTLLSHHNKQQILQAVEGYGAPSQSKKM